MPVKRRDPLVRLLSELSVSCLLPVDPVMSRRGAEPVRAILIQLVFKRGETDDALLSGTRVPCTQLFALDSFPTSWIINL